MGFLSAHLLQAGRPAGTPPGATGSMSPAQNPVPLRGVYPAGARSGDFRSYRMKGVYVPGPYEVSGRPRASAVIRGDRGGGERTTEDSPLVPSCMDAIDDKQVSRKFVFVVRSVQRELLCLFFQRGVYNTVKAHGS